MVNIWSYFAQIIGSGCALCRAPADGLCRACLDAALPRNLHPCPGCALPLPDGAPVHTLCAACQARAPSFDRAFAPLLYTAPLDDLIAGFKYHRRLPLGRILGRVLAQTLVDRPGRPQLLLPVPATPDRLRERGFNQAAELARTLAVHLDIAWTTRRLHRTRDAGPQRGLTRRERRRNLHGAFACRGRLPPHVALVDDVITTGATAEEASRALKEAGAERVEVWAVARTPLEAADLES